MGKPNRRVRAIDVLTARAAGPVRVCTNIPRIDVDHDIVVDLGGDEHGRKRRVAPIAGIERRLAHQPVDPGFGAQPAVGVVAAELDRRALDAGHVAPGHLHKIGSETALLPPHQVHAQQHLRPVLGFGAAGARLDVHERVGRVLVALEHAAELQLG